MNNKIIKYASGMTALALTFSLTMSGCSTSKFKLTHNEKGEYIAAENSYIDNENISKYYVIETYSTITNESKIYIAYYNNISYRNDDIGNYYEYINIFNNTHICYSSNHANNNITFIKEIPLIDFLNSYDFTKARYSYEDMKEIYETIKEDYNYEEPSLEQSSTDNKLIKKRTLI